MRVTNIETSCGHKFEVPGYYDKVIERGEAATFDCPECGKEQVLRGTITFHTRDFHEWLSELDPRWPKDGKNTGFIEVGGGEE